jgi:hypothetical protein
MHRRTQRKLRNVSYFGREMKGNGWKQGFPGLRARIAREIQGLVDVVRFNQHDIDLSFITFILMGNFIFIRSLKS